MSESAVFQGAAARRPATTKEMLPDRRSSEQRAVGVGRCAACLWRLPKCKGAALEERGEQRRTSGAAWSEGSQSARRWFCLREPIGEALLCAAIFSIRK
jgi:hypothetical protein